MINLTLIVQMIHFGVAYLILDRVLVRFVMRLVQREEQDVAQVRQQVTATTAELAEQQQEQAHAWRVMQQTLLQQRPRVQAIPHIVLPPSVAEPYELAPHDVAQLAGQFKDVIVDRVTHG